MSSVVLLDTSAFLTLTGQEPGEEEVEAYISDAFEGRVDLHACFVSLTEVEYITLQEEGPSAAIQRLSDVKALPIHWHHSDELLCSEAAKMKAAHRVSFADAFVAATCKRLGALLVHKDPEFAALGTLVWQHVLPAKTPGTA